MADDGDAVNVPLLRGNQRENTLAHLRIRVRRYMSSKQNHYVVMGLVALDVAGILVDLFISLIACDTGQRNEDWSNKTHEGFQIAGLVFSSLFMVELGLSVWAFGFKKYFSSWFHCFDGLVIILSFVVDLVVHGIAEEIASLVIILRLWRLVKLVEELSVGASERMEEIEAKVDDLERENSKLRNHLRTLGVNLV